MSKKMILFRDFLGMCEQMSSHVDEKTNLPLRWISRAGTLACIIDRAFFRSDDPYEFAEKILGAKDAKLDQLISFFYLLFKENGLRPEVVWRVKHYTGENRTERFDIFGVSLCFFIFTEHGREHVLGRVFTDSSEEDTVVAIRRFCWEEIGSELAVDVETFGRDDKGSLVKLELAERGYVGKHSGQELFDYWKKFSKKNETRSFFFLGVPGTGKTTVALDIARRAEGGVLRILAGAFKSFLTPTRAVKLVAILRPSVLLLDDIHLLSPSVMTDVLHMMEWINDTMETDTLVVATANRLSTVDAALRRPGRLDDAFFFDLPDDDERAGILRFYAEKLGCEEEMESRLDFVVGRTVDASPAYLMDIVKVVNVFKDDPLELDDVLERKLGVMEILLSKNSVPGKEEDERLRLKTEREKPALGFVAVS